MKCANSSTAWSHLHRVTKIFKYTSPQKSKPHHIIIPRNVKPNWENYIIIVQEDLVSYQVLINRLYVLFISSSITIIVKKVGKIY